MTATEYLISPETARSHIADALQILGSKPEAELDELDIAAVLYRLNLALARVDQEHATYECAIVELRKAERARMGLVEELHACHDELLTHRAVEKLLRVFIRDVDKSSMIVADYVQPIIEQEKARRAD